MSKENVALFIKAANKNEDLIRQIRTLMEPQPGQQSGTDAD